MNPLEKVALGESGVKVTRLGVGGTPLGGLYTDITEDAASATLERALELGLNLFDTAPLYGSGKSETRMGRVFAKNSRSRFVVATKVGFRLVPIDPNSNENIFFPFDNAPPLRPANDYSYDGALRSVEQSMERLKVDFLDIVHIHDPVGLFDDAMQGSYRALRRLREQGVIKAVSAAMNQVEMLIQFAHEGEFDCFLLALRHTLLEHNAFKELLPLCAEKKISLIIGAPYSSGILASGAVPGAKFCYLDAQPQVMEKVRQIESVCRDHSVPLKAAALQFTLCHPAIATVIPGGGSVAEVEENFRMLSHPIPTELWTALQRRGLLPQVELRFP
jgi:D-threo-aldose 1-dehydrogenase